jgi:hypothetical protein
MNKILVFGLLSILAIGLIFAGGYVYNNFIIKSDVKEPFSVQYAIIGDAGQWDGITHCDSVTTWAAYPNDFVLDVDGLYAGESRLFCAKVTNAAEADIPFTISNTIIDNEGNLDACKNAFGENSILGTAAKQSSTLGEFPIIVNADAQPVLDCLINIKASRG